MFYVYRISFFQTLIRYTRHTLNRRFEILIIFDRTKVEQNLVLRIVQYYNMFAIAEYCGYWTCPWDQNKIIENLMYFSKLYKGQLGQNDVFSSFWLRQMLKIRRRDRQVVLFCKVK